MVRTPGDAWTGSRLDMGAVPGRSPDSSGGELLEGNPEADAESLLGKTRRELGFAPLSSEGADILDAPQGPFQDLVLRGEDGHGQARYVLLSGAPVLDASGRCIGYRGTGKDMTASEQRRGMVERFQAAMDASPDLIFISDCETQQFVYVNDTACIITGYSHDELLRMRGYEFTGTSREEGEAFIEQVHKAGPAGASDEPRLARSKDGARAGWWQSHYRVVEIDGRLLLISSSREVTDRVIAEQAARRAKRMYAALSASNEAIIRAQTPETLFENVCRVAVEEETGGRDHIAGQSGNAGTPCSGHCRS